MTSLVYGCLVARDGAVVVYAVDDRDWDDDRELRGRIVELWAARRPEDLTDQTARRVAELVAGG